MPLGTPVRAPGAMAGDES